MLHSDRCASLLQRWARFACIGRNYKQWFSPTANVRERYDHLYSMEELEPWVDRIRKISKDTKETYAIANNHYLGKGPANTLEIAAMLGRIGVDAPPTLVEKYPVLAEFEKTQSQ